MKLNPPPLTLRSKISSRSDFIHDSGFIPTKADLVEKNPLLSTDKRGFFSGGKIGIRTLVRGLPETRFPVVRLRPAQPSVHRIKLSLSRKKGIGASDGT